MTRIPAGPTSSADSSRTPTRRAVATAAAWSIPTVALAVATPAAAASPAAWNIALAAGCPPVLPGDVPGNGFVITASGGTPPSTMQFVESYSLRIEFPAAEWSQAYGVGQKATEMLLDPARTHVQDTRIRIDDYYSWVTQTDSIPGDPSRAYIEFLSTRYYVTVSGLAAGSSVSYAHTADFSTVDLKGYTPTYSFALGGTDPFEPGESGEGTPSEGSKGSDTGDDFAVISGSWRGWNHLC